MDPSKEVTFFPFLKYLDLTPTMISKFQLQDAMYRVMLADKGGELFQMVHKLIIESFFHLIDSHGTTEEVVTSFKTTHTRIEAHEKKAVRKITKSIQSKENIEDVEKEEGRLKLVEKIMMQAKKKNISSSQQLLETHREVIQIFLGSYQRTIAFDSSTSERAGELLLKDEAGNDKVIEALTDLQGCLQKMQEAISSEIQSAASDVRDTSTEASPEKEKSKDLHEYKKEAKSSLEAYKKSARESLSKRPSKTEVNMDDQ